MFALHAGMVGPTLFSPQRKRDSHAGGELHSCTETCRGVPPTDAMGAFHPFSEPGFTLKLLGRDQQLPQGGLTGAGNNNGSISEMRMDDMDGRMSNAERRKRAGTIIGKEREVKHRSRAGPWK